jgi:hypothetical protein
VERYALVDLGPLGCGMTGAESQGAVAFGYRQTIIVSLEIVKTIERSG